MPSTSLLGLRYPAETGVLPDVPVDMQNLANDVEKYLAAKAWFWGVITGATAIAGGANIPFTPQEDPLSGWGGATHAWTAPYAGLYDVRVQVKWGATGPGTVANAAGKLYKNSTAVLTCTNAASVAQYNGWLLEGPVRCAIGDTIAVQPTTAGGFTTQDDSPAINTFMTIRWIGA